MLRKVGHLARRNQFHLAIPHDVLLKLLEAAFNAYCRLTREGHGYTAFLSADTTLGGAEREVERAIFANV